MRRASLKPELIESISLLKRSKPKIWVEAYGCSASMADFEMIRGVLKNAGYLLAENETESSLNLIVTCSVKDRTEHRMVHRISRFARSQKPLIVAGCLPKADEVLVNRVAPRASLMGPYSIDRASEIVAATIGGSRMVALDDSGPDKIKIPRVRLNDTIGILEIASGCLSECSFCQTKFAKGELRSYRPRDICDQIRQDVSDGCREIWLTSTDNGCYGRDIGTNLAELLDECSRINVESPSKVVPDEFMIRVGMLNPMYLGPMEERLIKAFQNERIFKFLHIPVQSGSDSVLRTMKRGHTAKAFIDSVRAFRAAIPQITIATDVIVGFPSETSEDFESTIRLLKTTEPDIINISRYGARPGTAGAKMRPRVGSSVSKDRSAAVHNVAKKIMAKRNSIWLGWVGQIIIDEVNGSFVQGRNFAYKSVILNAAPKNAGLGLSLTVEVTGYTPLALRANAL